MTDPYDTLGLSRSASDAEVKAAYRKLAKRYHPDRNPGDDDAKAKYAAVDAAYSLLSDPERRARYDRTGEAGEPNRQHPQADVVAVLVPCMMQAVSALLEQGGKADRSNLVAYMTRVLEQERKARKANREQLERGRAAFEVASKRFAEPAEDGGLLASVAAHHVAAIDAQITQAVAEEAQLARALEYLAKCTYDFAPGAFAGWAHPRNASASVNTFWGVG